MNKKLQTFFDKPKRKVAEKQKEKDVDVSKYLIEENRIEPSDLDNIDSYIKKPRFGTFVLKAYTKNYDESEREVDVHISNGRRTITFEYNKDFDELTMAIIDYCDTNGLTFKEGSERPTNIAWVAVYK